LHNANEQKHSWKSVTFTEICKRGCLVIVVIAETREHVRRWGSSGYLVVDMEAAAIFAVAKYFGADRAAVLPAADLVVEGRTVLDTVEEGERLNLEKAKNSTVEIAFGL